MFADKDAPKNALVPWPGRCDRLIDSGTDRDLTERVALGGARTKCPKRHGDYAKNIGGPSTWFCDSGFAASRMRSVQVTWRELSVLLK